MRRKTIFLLLIHSIYYFMATNEVDAKRYLKRRHGTCACGKSAAFDPNFRSMQPFVINGDAVVPIYKYPWMVKVRSQTDSCTGVMISIRHVLTAGHCFVKKLNIDGIDPDLCDVIKKSTQGDDECQIMASLVTVTHMTEKGLGEPLEISKYYIHPQYNYDLEVFDMAIAVIPGSFPCDSFTRPICLPNKDLAQIGQQLIVAGWGQSRVGQPGTQPSGKLLEAKQTVRAKQDPWNENPKTCEEKGTSTFCAAGNKQNTCYGDSGGPIFYMNPTDSRFYTVGVTAFGTALTCSEQGHTYFTNVYMGIKFIKEVLLKQPERRIARFSGPKKPKQKHRFSSCK